MIYTKKGDEGQTSLVGGERVWKCDERVEAYGTVDELNSHMVLLRDQCPYDEDKSALLAIQRQLFILQSLLAAEHPEKHSFLPELSETEVEKLERAIDAWERELPPFRAFVIAGGHPLVSQCHVARCVCRRAERRVIALMRRSEVPSAVPHYLNRLSDYLFVMARHFAQQLNIKEDTWS